MIMERGKIQNAVLALLVFAFTGFQSAKAVNICFWTAAGCTGSALCCNSIQENRCCNLVAEKWKPYVKITASSSCKQTRLYSGGACATEVARFVNNLCVSGARFTGGKWLTVCRRRQLLADVEHEQSTCAAADDTTKCAKYVEPNAISYKEPSGKGSWVLLKENALGSYEQFLTLADSEKVDWLTAQGATLIFAFIGNTIVRTLGWFWGAVITPLATYKSERQEATVNVEN